MNFDEIIMPLAGGALIGFSVSLLLFLKGRVFGVSGILAGVLVPKTGETAWRVAAVLGFVAAGAILSVIFPRSLFIETQGSGLRYVLAGLMVGFGTQLGSGCTSGHGVCGISRMSIRSILATLTFIGAGVLMVALLRFIGVTL